MVELGAVDEEAEFAEVVQRHRAPRAPPPGAAHRLRPRSRGVRAAGTMEVPWLEPFPDALLDEAESAAGPEAEATARETIELALLAAIQHLAPLQRAVVILRDLPGWPAADSAEALGTSPASLNSALRRGRRVLGEQLPPRRSDRAGAGYRGAASAVATPGSAGPRKCGRGRTAASSTALPAATPSRSRP